MNYNVGEEYACHEFSKSRFINIISLELTNKELKALKSLLLNHKSCSDGWFNLIYSLCKEIDELYRLKGRDNDDLNIEQVKEKNGELRFYVGNYIDVAMEIIDKYEVLSRKTYEVCGKEGKITGKRWVRTLCDECYKG